MRETIGKVPLILDYYTGTDSYSDGTVEDDLLQLVRQYPESEFPKLILERNSWAILYHLSKVRENIIEWLDFGHGSDTVLEIGAGCGAVTGILAQKAKQVTCVELSKKRSTINAARHSDMDNIEILVGNFQQVEPHLGQYDVVTLIGVLEYAASYIDAKEPFLEMLKIARKHLAPGGRLVLAIENKLGMKYWAGCPEDHLSVYFKSIEGYGPEDRIRTFSKKELQALFSAAGYQDTDFYYPYPDYKLPICIFGDDHLPAAGELRQNLRNFDGERIILFDEGKAFDNVIENDLFPIFSNSFLVVAKSGAEKGPTQYAKYSRDRGPAFQIRTAILRENGRKRVEKAPLTPAAAAHIQRLASSYQKLKEQYEGTPLNICPCEIQNGTAVFDYIEGDTLTSILRKMVAAADEEGTTRLCMELAQLVRSAKRLRPFVKTQAFIDVFGDAQLPEGLTTCDYSNIDMIMDNFIVSGRSLTLLDYEWCFDFPVPIEYTLFRMFYYTFEKWNREEYVMQTLCPLLGIPESAVSAFQKMEKVFREYVCRDAFRIEDAYYSMRGVTYPFALLHDAAYSSVQLDQELRDTIQSSAVLNGKLAEARSIIEARQQYLAQHRVRAAVKALLGML